MKQEKPGNWQQFLQTSEKRARKYFYWDDEVLGVRPTWDKSGSYLERETLLKENTVSGLVVIFADNNEICEVQTLALIAEAADFSNIGEFILANIESPAIGRFLQVEEVRAILRAEFDYLRLSLLHLVAENDALRSQQLDQYWRDQEQRLTIIQATSLIQFLEEQVAIYQKAYEALVAEIDGEAQPEKPVGRVDHMGRDDAFGGWLYLDLPGLENWVQ